MNSYKFSDMRIGLSDKFSVTISEEMMDDFLKISGDENPLHRDAAHAKEKGFNDKVVYGLLTASFYSRLVGVYLPGKYCLLQGIDIAFTSPVYIGDVLTIYGEVSYINDAFKRIEIKAYITNQDNEKVSKAKIGVEIYE